MYIFLFTTFGTGISQELHFKSKLAIYLECVHFFRKFAFFFSFGGGEWGLEPFLTFQTLLWGHKNISVEDLRHMLLVAWSPFGTSRGIWWSSSSQMLLCCHHQEHLPKLLISAELWTPPPLPTHSIHDHDNFKPGLQRCPAAVEEPKLFCRIFNQQMMHEGRQSAKQVS